MWINFTFHHMMDVEKSEISLIMCTIYGILLHFKLFCCKICVFLAIYAVLSQNWFVAIYALMCGENFSKNSVRGEKWQILGMVPIWYIRKNPFADFSTISFSSYFSFLFFSTTEQCSQKKCLQKCPCIMFIQKHKALCLQNQNWSICFHRNPLQDTGKLL